MPDNENKVEAKELRGRLGRRCCKGLIMPVVVIAVMIFFTGCQSRNVWTYTPTDALKVTESLDEPKTESPDDENIISPESGEETVLEAVEKIKDLNTYHLRIEGSFEWKRKEDSRSYQFVNDILMDRSSKCFEQQWSVQDLSRSGSAREQGVTVGKNQRLNIGDGKGKWEEVNPELFQVVFTNLDTPLKHLHAFEEGSMEVTRTSVQAGKLVIDVDISLEGNSAAAFRSLITVVDPDLTVAEVTSFKGKSRLYFTVSNMQLFKEDLEGEYEIDGQICPVKLKVEFDKFNQPVKLSSPI